MGGSEAYEMGHNSRHELIDEGGKKGKECTVSVPMGFLLLLISILICVVVALVVFFATNANTATSNAAQNCPQISMGSGVWWNDPNCLKTCIKQGICDDSGNLESTTALVPTSKPDGKPEIRLPNTLIPISYVVEMKPDIYQTDPADFTNTGNVSILMQCKAATSKVSLHINKLTVTTYSLTDENNNAIALDTPIYDKERQFVIFGTGSPLSVGKNYTIHLGYSGPLSNDLAGLYYSSYTAADGSRRYIATTQFQPTDARKAFPCFDEPALKANFTISLWRKPHYSALSNMPIARNMTEGGWVKDTFKETVKMSTYLLAMIVCDFDYKEQNTTGGTRFRVWSRKEAIDQTDYALSQGVQILTYFESFFDETFPLPKTDMIAIPDFAAGAMENWGLITYRETALLYDPLVSAASNKQRVAVVVSHELAHQWFGNLVSPSWWDDLWLNEGFATYVEYIGVNHTEPEWQMLDQFVTSDVQSTLKADSLATSHPIYVPVQHPDEINEIFDSISYGKGGSLIRMMRYFLGDVVFENALANYIEEKKYDAAHHTHLWKAMQDEADRVGLKDDRGRVLNLKDILDTWLLQMGYPLLEVMSNPSTGGSTEQLTITQKHFLQDDTQEPDPKYPSPFGYRWDVPISYVTSDAPNFDVDYTSVKWFYRTEDSRTITVNSNIEWLIINPKQYGFYRVNYPEAYWNKLIATQDRDHTEIDELNRAQIIDDAFNLALAGKLRITYAMELTKYLGKEQSYFPWDAAISSLSYVSRALSRTSAYGDFKKYYSGLILPYYNAFNGNWVFNSGDSIISQYRQSSAIGRACAYDVGDCRTRAKSLLATWMGNNATNPIHPNVRSTVYCNAIRSGGEAEWNFIYEMFKVENVAGEQVKLLQSLGCTNELWLLQRLLDYAVDDDKIRKQDSYIAVSAVASNTLGGFLAWDWLRANWESLSEKYGVGIMMLGRFVSSTTRSFFTQYELEEMEAFTTAKGDLGTATRAFAQAKEQAQNNIKYLELNQAALTDWLSKNAPAN